MKRTRNDENDEKNRPMKKIKKSCKIFDKIPEDMLYEIMSFVEYKKKIKMYGLLRLISKEISKKMENVDIIRSIPLIINNKDDIHYDNPYLQKFTWINIKNATDLSVYLLFNQKRGKKIEQLDISRCYHITDSAIKYMAGIVKLNISCCLGITGKTFEHLKGIHTLDISWCKNITDKAFEHLSSIKELKMVGCHQKTITDKAFKYLRNIKKLDMRNCNQETITDEAFENLKIIKELNMAHCHQKTITNKTLKNLIGINK